MNIFLTGSEGFIGTHLKKRLIKEGHTVVGLDNLSHSCKHSMGGNVIYRDILNINDCSLFIKQCDYIIHLAAQINVEYSILNPSLTLATNTIGTLAVLEMATKYNKPIIFASTTEIYGDKQTEKMAEAHPTNPKSPYAASKLGADGLCKAFYHSYGTKVIIVRNFNTFGKYQSDDAWGAVIAIFADRLNNNLPPIVFGDGTQRRDFMGYKDAIDFYMLMIENGKEYWGQEFNVGMGTNISIGELAREMIHIFGMEGKIEPIHADPRPGEVHEFLCDNTKALNTGWKPNMDFNSLMREYIQWKLANDNPKVTI